MSTSVKPSPLLPDAAQGEVLRWHLDRGEVQRLPVAAYIDMLERELAALRAQLGPAAAAPDGFAAGALSGSGVGGGSSGGMGSGGGAGPAFGMPIAMAGGVEVLGPETPTGSFGSAGSGYASASASPASSSASMDGLVCVSPLPGFGERIGSGISGGSGGGGGWGLGLGLVAGGAASAAAPASMGSGGIPLVVGSPLGLPRNELLDYLHGLQVWAGVAGSGQGGWGVGRGTGGEWRGRLFARVAVDWWVGGYMHGQLRGEGRGASGGEEWRWVHGRRARDFLAWSCWVGDTVNTAGPPQLPSSALLYFYFFTTVCNPPPILLPPPPQASGNGGFKELACSPNTASGEAVKEAMELFVGRLMGTTDPAALTQMNSEFSSVELSKVLFWLLAVGYTLKSIEVRAGGVGLAGWWRSGRVWVGWGWGLLGHSAVSKRVINTAPLLYMCVRVRGTVIGDAVHQTHTTAQVVMRPRWLWLCAYVHVHVSMHRRAWTWRTAWAVPAAPPAAAPWAAAPRPAARAAAAAARAAAAAAVAAGARPAEARATEARASARAASAVCVACCLASEARLTRGVYVFPTGFQGLVDAKSVLYASAL